MLHLFDAFGIELEYMIVDRECFDVRPISDVVLRDESGQPVSDVERGSVSWSNELTHHVIELKTTEPAPSLGPLAEQFQSNIREIDSLLEHAGARLLPTAMHPWMDPFTEMQLWPHEFHAVYETFHKIFDCRGHGWANLQSMHINLPFGSDEEFGKLHAACRLILPFLPGLAASSPFRDGTRPGQLCCRLDAYRNNAGRVPSVAGRVIPEQVYDQSSYRREIFDPMMRDVAPYDSQGVLEPEFLNARGAIARFGRGAIEIRVIDVQECPRADLAIAALTIAVLNNLVSEKWSSTADQQAVTIDQLEPLLLSSIQDADQAVVKDANVLGLFGITESSISLQDFWQQMRAQAADSEIQKRDHGPTLDIILNEGCLARRMSNSVGAEIDRDSLLKLYSKLAECLRTGELFRA